MTCTRATSVVLRIRDSVRRFATRVSRARVGAVVLLLALLLVLVSACADPPERGPRTNSAGTPVPTVSVRCTASGITIVVDGPTGTVYTAPCD